MCLEHERIHIETSSVLMRELPIHLVSPPDSWPDLLTSHNKWVKPEQATNFPTPEMVHIPAGKAVMGKPTQTPTYGWDNEFGTKTIHVNQFNVSSTNITNGQFYDFVVDGGYRDPTLWSEDGWGWCCFRNIRKPTFWIEDGPKGLNQFKLRTVFSEEAMQWDWPVIVNYHEAKAFCAWQTRNQATSQPFRVLTEAEHWRLRDSATDDGIMRQDFDANTNMVNGSERSVTARPPNSKGLYDVFGNAWDWCEDHQAPFDGFELHHLYDDFTLPCFDGEHNLIMGGSFASTGDQSSIYARYQFRPHFFQHASFRLTQPLDDPWLVTSCMGSAGPYASAQSPYRNAL
jgi:5-histidylcysteine sulfoxide synthase